SSLTTHVDERTRRLLHIHTTAVQTDPSLLDQRDRLLVLMDAPHSLLNDRPEVGVDPVEDGHPEEIRRPRRSHQLHHGAVDEGESSVGLDEDRLWGQLHEQHRGRILKRTDRLFAGFMAAQWVAGVLAALWISPRAWSGAESRVHVHVWAAVFLGGAIAAFPIFLALTRPGAPSTRHTIAVAQMLVSALLIHLTGGRIETHFHVFGSLAFLAFYRDWRVLISASF